MHGKLKSKATSLTRLHVRVTAPARKAGRLVGGGFDVAASIGRSGLTALKREGDGASPRGSFRILGGWYRADHFRSRPLSGLKLRPLAPDMGWCDDACDRNYNRPVRRPYPASHEAMWRDDGLYDIVLLLDINLRPRVKKGGSAIFFHLRRDDRGPTAGCVAIARRDMLKLLPRLTSRSRIVIG